MKKAILIIATALISAVTLAQDATAKKDSLKTVYKADPARVYLVGLTFEQLNILIQTSQAGLIPYLKSVKLTMDRLDSVQGYHAALINQVAGQYRQQYLADSTKKVQPAIKKK